MDKSYINTLKNILGEEKFRELSDLLFKDVDKIFREIKIDIAIISIIGVELARGCKEDELSKRITWYNIAEKSMFLEENINMFYNRYKKYIQIVESKVKEENK